MHKTGKSGGFLGRDLGPLLKTGLPLMKTVLKLLAKIVLIPLRLKAAGSATLKTCGINCNNYLYNLLWYQNINNFERGDEWFRENSQINWRIWLIDIKLLVKLKQKNKNEGFSAHY